MIKLNKACWFVLVLLFSTPLMGMQIDAGAKATDDMFANMAKEDPDKASDVAVRSLVNLHNKVKRTTRALINVLLKYAHDRDLAAAFNKFDPEIKSVIFQAVKIRVAHMHLSEPPPVERDEDTTEEYGTDTEDDMTSDLSYQDKRNSDLLEEQEFDADNGMDTPRIQIRNGGESFGKYLKWLGFGIAFAYLMYNCFARANQKMMNAPA